MPDGDAGGRSLTPPGRFEFATANRIVFGDGASAELPALVASFGRRALIVTGADPARFAGLVARIREACRHSVLFSVAGEPEIACADSGAHLAREERCDVVVAIGGGAVIDAGKAVAALATNEAPVLDHLEVVGAGRPLNRAPLPCLAVPTTAGTGSEATRNSVLTVPSAGVKASLRGVHLLPRVALVDPRLAHGLPRALTATSGMDALTQVIEPFLCLRANAFVDALCRDAIPRAARALPRVCTAPGDAAARAEMALVALQGGMALANAGLGAVHGFAAPIGGAFRAPHGAVCAALLPHVLRANLRALRRRSPGSAMIGRWEELARLLTGRADACAEDAAEWCAALGASLGIPPLSSHGIGTADLDSLATKAASASSMKANPVALTHDELVEILHHALG